MSASNAELHLLESQRNLFSEIVTALEPVRKAPKALQQQHLTLGDFYAIWFRCKLEISKASPTEFSQLLLSSIKNANWRYWKMISLWHAFFWILDINISFVDARYKFCGMRKKKHQWSAAWSSG